MITAGIDIGTTSISAVLWDAKAKKQLDSKTIPNNTRIKTEAFMHEQDAQKIISVCLEVIGQWKAAYPQIGRIGITGQMHGIVYVGQEGNLLSSLITWQDERGNQPYKDGVSYARYLQDQTGYPMSTGYGLTTHFCQTVQNRIPEGASRICTIMDYLAMVLCKEKEPVIHPSNAASLGLFDIQGCRFDEEAVRRAGMDPSFLPKVISGEQVIGTMADGTEVLIPIGDNQAGTYAVLTNPKDVLVNLGTSSQISMICDRYTIKPGLECRPYVKGKYLLLYAGLCGGVSFAMLNNFFQEVCRIFSAEASKEEVYARMMEEAEKACSNPDALTVSTLFRGKRSDPSLRGSVTNIDMNNFTPGNLILGFYRGVIGELMEAYRQMEAAENGGELLLGGNALRRNPLLRRLCGEMFGRKVRLLELKEEAALGAAFLAADEAASR